jgi:ferredoxin-NADP reductase
MFWTAQADFGIIRSPKKVAHARETLVAGDRFSARWARARIGKCRQVSRTFRNSLGFRMGISSQTLGLTVGWLAVGWVAVQLTTFIVRTVERRLHSRQAYLHERAEFCRRVSATARAARAAKAIPDWIGWRPLRVAAVVDESRDVKSYYFTPVDGRPLSPFSPGQYLTFRLPISPSNSPLVRCYSLSDRPREDYYRTTIKRVGAPPGQASLPPGRGSSYFHDHVKVGDVLDVRAPAGTFSIDPHDKEPIVLIGAGIGVTPLVCMLEAIVNAGRQREVYALFGFRNSQEHPFKARLARLAEANSQLHLHVCYSSPGKSDVLYKDYTHRGRLTMGLIRQMLPSNNFQFYLCGPGPMMESLVPALWEWGVPEPHVHFEAFGPASVKSADRVNERAGVTCEVRFERSGSVAMWDGSFASLLEFGESLGIAIPSGCRAGSCGECMTAVRSGRSTTLKQPGIHVPPGHCLPCISAPAEAIVLEA